MTRHASVPIPLVVILGPTASGKTEFALELSSHFPAEAVGADSRQVYRFMDIGTAKPTPLQQARLEHHVIDIVDPDEPFHLGEYLRRANGAIDAIRDRGHTPLLVGGSPQYVWAIVEGWDVPAVAPDVDYRSTLLQRARSEGALALHEQLRLSDSAAARAIHPHNVRRVIRALELLKQTGRPASLLRERQVPRSDVIIFGIRVARAELYARIDARVDAMFEGGLVEEVQRLLELGYDRSLPSLSGIGYTQVIQWLAGEIEFADAMSAVKSATHRFARRQSTWFRAADPRIVWLERSEVDTAAKIIRSWKPSGALTAPRVVA